MGGLWAVDQWAPLRSVRLLCSRISREATGTTIEPQEPQCRVSTWPQACAQTFQKQDFTHFEPGADQSPY